MTIQLAEYVSHLGLIDHHCHGVTSANLSSGQFEALATESSWRSPFGGSNFDTPFGVAVRALCAPELGLEAHCTGEQYMERRIALGPDAVNQTLLRGTGIERYVVETGVGAHMLGPKEVADAAGAEFGEIDRLEALAEDELALAENGEDFVARMVERIGASAARSLGFKSIVAYRCGLDFDPDQPTRDEVRDAADRLLRARTSEEPVRLEDPVVIRFLIWEAVRHGCPLQFHVGYGDSDIDLHRCDPSKMTEFIRRTVDTGASIMLLHCYPFQREAAFLAQVYPHVYLDTGAAVNYTGFGSHAIIRESLELAPFNKVMFSTDAYGLPELYYCGSHLWRRGVARVFGDWVADDEMSLDDAKRYLDMIAVGNAAKVYGR